MNDPSERDQLRQVARIAVILAAVASVALWVVRVSQAFSFTLPNLAVTTGLEEESMYSIWKFTEAQPVYTDPNGIPFSASYFNWGFYCFYGCITEFFLFFLRLHDSWLATIGRGITMALTLVTAGIFFRLVRDFGRSGWFTDRTMAVTWSVLATFSPLVGFWSITLRPDIGALMFELAGLYVFFQFLRRRNIWLILPIVCLFYAAWSFKQTSVIVLTGSVITLLILKEWRAVALLCGLWWTLVGVTLFAGGDIYRQCLLFSQLNLPFMLLVGACNALRAVLKNDFYVLALVVMALSSSRWLRGFKAHPVSSSVCLIGLLTTPLVFLAACKLGASDNYYFPAVTVAMLTLALNLTGTIPRWIDGALIACSVILIAGIAVTPFHRIYNYDLHAESQAHWIVAQRQAALPGPLYSTERFSNLPWMHPTEPNFVRGYAYEFDRAAQVPCENGGIENMIKSGYFSTVVLSGSNPRLEEMLRPKYDLVDEYRDPYYFYEFYELKP